MNYNEAIIKIGENYPLDIFSNAFYVRSIISDYIGSDFQALKLRDTLFLLSDFVDLYQLFTTHSLLEGRKILNSIYQSVKSSCSIRDYIDAINPISKLILPNEFTSVREHKHESKACAVKVSKQKAVVKKEQVELVFNKYPTVYQPLPNYDDIISVTFKVIAKSLTIKSHCKTSIKVLINNMDVTRSIINPNSMINKNRLNGLICYPNDDVILLLPDNKDYKYFKIDAKKTTINIQDIKAKKLVISNNNATLNVNGNVTRLKVESHYGFLDLRGNYEYVDVDINNSSIYFNIGPYNTKLMELDMHCINGDIYGDFTSGKPVPRITKILGINRNLKGTTTIGKCLLNYRFNVTGGHVKI